MRCYGLSDIGLLREVNQDSFFYAFNENKDFIALVCDGIGGGKAGDVASNIAVETFKKLFKEKPVITEEKDIRNWILKSVMAANDAIYEDSITSRKKQGMGTTLVGVLISEGFTHVFHLGDSRLYALYSDFVCLTEDHNLATDLMKTGELSENDAFAHPQGRALTNALGIWDKYKVDINKVEDGYRSILLCSDGLHGFVDEKIIVGILESSCEIEEKVQQLIDSANQAGGYDNVTAILIEEDA